MTVSFLLVFILMALTGATSGLTVAWLYERGMRRERANALEDLISEFDRLSKDIRKKGEELARQDGIAIGRECDALQKKMADGLMKGKSVKLVCTDPPSTWDAKKWTTHTDLTATTDTPTETDTEE